jgi:hypothetical protein
MTQIDPEKIETVVRTERDRLVALLRRMADKLEAAPLDRLTDGATWIAPIADVLVKTVERALSRTK